MPKKVKSKKKNPSFEVHLPKKDNSGQQLYAEVIKFMGANWVLVKCDDGLERRVHIRGSLQRFKSSGTKMVPGDIILISIRDTKTGDIILKYPDTMARAMKKAGELNIQSATNNDVTDEVIGDNVGFEFEEDEKGAKPTPAPKQKTIQQLMSMPTHNETVSEEFDFESI